MKETGFLKAMVQKVQARRVIEIGTFTGDSALAIAEALPDDGTLITCEINAGLAALARKRFGRSPHGGKIEVRIGPALNTLTELAGPFDLIFVDADTANYVEYFHAARKLLNPGGAILFDNMQGSVMDPMIATSDPSIRAVQELSRVLTADAQLSAELVAVRDGVMVIIPKPSIS